MKVLVTDGHLKAALAAVRHLGDMGIEVHTTQEWPGTTVSSASAFITRSHLLPPADQPEEFDSAFISLLQRERFDYVFPTSDTTLRQISANRRRIAELVRVDLPPTESLRLVFSKAGVIEIAQSLGIRVPRTVHYRTQDDPAIITDNLDFPIVAKKFPGETYDRVQYINTPQELELYLASSAPAETLLFQEYIEGTGCGVFAFFHHAQPVLCHMHQRLWEYPATGGPSVLAKNLDDPVLEEQGLKLLRKLRWTGVAMVEFKKAKDNSYVFMEINPRLWGSLDLSLACGADFLSLALAQDRARAAKRFVLTEATFLWVAPDSFLFLLSRPSKVFQFVKLLLSPRVRKDIRLDDLRPLWQQFREVGYWIRQLIAKGRLRHPHSRPLVDANRVPWRKPEKVTAGDTLTVDPLDASMQKEKSKTFAAM